jgi:SH3-like domain-containing protein
MKNIKILLFQMNLICIFILITSFSLKDISTAKVKHVKLINKNCFNSRLSVCWDDPDNSGTNIRNSPGGEIIYKIMPVNFPDGCCFDIIEASNGWFKISGLIHGIENDINLPNNQGWVHKSVISIGTRNYGDQPIKLYDVPNGKNVVSVIRTTDYGLRINDICGSWVQIIYKGKIGWVQDDWLCGNPWTNCS